MEYGLIRRCVIWFFFKKKGLALVGLPRQARLWALKNRPSRLAWLVRPSNACLLFFFLKKINYSFSYFKFMFKLVLLLFFVLFGKSLLNDNYFFSCAFKFEVFSDASIFFLSFVWMNFIFKSKKNIFSDNISNMCNLAWCFCSFYFILSI